MTYEESQALRLRCTPLQLEKINAALPEGTMVWGPLYKDHHYIGADLLTDAENYGAAFHLLEKLAVVDPPVIPQETDELV